MNSQQYRAGFCLDPLRNYFQEKKDNQLRGLLDALCVFDVHTQLPIRDTKDLNLNPLFAVLSNIICRGLPTRPSIEIEKTFASKLELTRHEIKAGSHLFHFQNPGSHAEHIFRALHTIDPRISIGMEDYQTHQLGSNFEENFLFSYLPASYRFLNQVFQSQRSISTIVTPKMQRHLRGQKVDFSLESPYWQEKSITINGRTEKVHFHDGLVVEIDGEKYHTFEKLANDRLRDYAEAKAEWKYQRISSKDVRAGLSSLKQSLDSFQFFQHLKKEYDNKSFDADRLKWWQLVLSPFGIARIQKVLVELLLQDQFPKKEKIKLGIIERDVPCGQLAVEDFIRQWQALNALMIEGYPIPDIEVGVFTTEEFRNAHLHDAGKPPRLISEFTTPDEFDLVIDHSIWRRSGIYSEDNKPNLHSGGKTVVIRSAHFADNQSERHIYTGQQIEYKPLVETLPNEVYKELPEEKASLTYFLQNIFRKDAFRPGQLPILSRALQHQTVIGLLPTGGGKSLTYQMAALLQPGVSMVIDPIRSLMQDQYDSLVSAGIDTCNYINSTLSGKQRRRHTDALKEGQVLFCFLSPERLQIEEFRKALSEMKKNKVFFSYCVIDEVHCVSEWGHDFRTSYLALGHNAIRYCQTLSAKPITLFGLTATASFDVLADVERELAPPGGNLDANAIVRFENTVRPELHYIIIPVKPDLEQAFSPREVRAAVGEAKQSKLVQLLKRMGEDGFNTLNDAEEQKINAQEIYQKYLSDHERTTVEEEDFINDTFEKVSFPHVDSFFEEDNSRSGIVFCPHRAGLFGVTDKYKRQGPNAGIAEKIEQELTGLPISVGTFIGSSDENGTVARQIDKDSFENQRLFRENKLNLMVSTKAFGMGIDKPNIRFTVHINYPSSIESFVQESGRAGRDGHMAINFLLFSEASNVDKDIQLFFHNNSFKGIEKELVVIDELLTEIIFPPSTTLHMLEDKIAEATGHVVKLNIFNGDHTSIIYVNEDYGHLNLHNGALNVEPTDGAEEVMRTLQEYINTAKEENGIDTVENLKAWLNIGQDHYTAPGIERIWDELTTGATQKMIVPFFNAYDVDDLLFAGKLSGILSKYDITFSPDAIKERVLNKTPNSEDEVIRKVNWLLRDQEIEQSITEEVLSWWRTKRSKADTDKAIFRMLCIGLIDDYTVDYNQKTYTITLKKQSEAFYRKAYRQFLERYYSDQRAAQLLKDAENINEPTLFRRYLRHMVHFIYDQVGQKRRLGIEDMESLCKQGLASDVSIHEKNRLLKEFIFLYFNSKYARFGYEIDGMPYSLVEDTEEGKISSWEIVWKYMKAVRIDPTGSDADNVKHLRGAALRLLRGNPDNSSLQLLKGFSLLIVAAITQQKILIPEAMESITLGFLSFQNKENMSNQDLTEKVEHFKTLTLEFTNRMDLKDLLDEALDKLFLTILGEKVNQLKQKILLNHG
ncbi:DEAD/DEAH box helicase [Phaeodactylibacter xiamenensis]|uniref:DEAD/DEAH box helicase n=1 Tax=Phaeodactylibacter xiamenensis TaxID=1524460 RepID=UPI0024A92C4B|nr:DEAD/DEAH box helicase [Phaeodactylibacter xiamenensis]